MRVIVSGNANYGLAAALKARFTEAEFWSRSCGEKDLCRPEVQDAFAERSRDFSLYVSCSALKNFNQTLLLEKVVQKWTNAGHTGRIIAVGSTADVPVRPTTEIYPIEKKALRDYCRNLSMGCRGVNGNKPFGFAITYLSLGYLKTEGLERPLDRGGSHELDTDNVASLIEWLAHQPPALNINELTIDPIQGNAWIESQKILWPPIKS